MAKLNESAQTVKPSKYDRPLKKEAPAKAAGPPAKGGAAAKKPAPKKVVEEKKKETPKNNDEEPMEIDTPQHQPVGGFEE